MFADPEIPVRMADPLDVEVFLETKWKIEIGPANQFIEDDAVINPLDAHLAPVQLVKQLPPPLLYLGHTHGTNAEQCPRRRKIHPRLLFVRLDLEPDHALRLRAADNRPPQNLDVGVVRHTSKRRGPITRNCWISLSQTMKREELESKKTGERLEPDQIGREHV